MKLHWHKECELLRVISGTFDISINGMKYTLQKGDILFLNGGSVHSGIPNNCIYECVVFELHSLKLKNSLQNSVLEELITLNKKINNFYNKENNEMYEILNNIFETFKEKKKGYELKVYGLLYSFLGAVEENDYYQKQNSIKIANKQTLCKLEKIFSYIEENYMEELTLHDLAALLDMNDKYFCRFFKKITQKTPIDYLNYYRIECACQKMKTSASSITDIAYDCGFNDTSYFTKIFKKYMGVTPREYSKQL